MPRRWLNRSEIIEWDSHLLQAVAACGERFQGLYPELEMDNLQAADLCERTFRRYIQYLKLTEIRSPVYLNSTWGLNRLAYNWVEIEGTLKWAHNVFRKALNPKLELKDDELLDILLWSALRYNFWLEGNLK